MIIYTSENYTHIYPNLSTSLPSLFLKDELYLLDVCCITQLTISTGRQRWRCSQRRCCPHQRPHHCQHWCLGWHCGLNTLDCRYIQTFSKRLFKATKDENSHTFVELDADFLLSFSTFARYTGWRTETPIAAFIYPSPSYVLCLEISSIRNYANGIYKSYSTALSLQCSSPRCTQINPLLKRK